MTLCTHDIISLVTTTSITNGLRLAPRRVLEGVTRGLGVLACIIIALIAHDLGQTFQQITLVALLAIIASIPQHPVALRYGTILAESVIAALIVVSAPAGIRPALAYLVIPPIIAALNIGVLGVLSTVTASALVLIVGTVLADQASLPAPVVEITVWLAIAIALGLAAVLARHLRERLAPRDAGYDTARQLLLSLRDIARTLPEGLEESVLARTTLLEIGSVLPHDQSAVVMFTPSGAPIEVARTPDESISWHIATDRGLVNQALETGAAAQRLGRFDGYEIGSNNASAAVPLRMDGRLTGVIILERHGGLWPIEDLTAAQVIADTAALRLDTARIFDEIRDVATVAERHRLSREIHDGIAQEVAGLGFLVDDLVERTHDEGIRTDLLRIRDELTRMVRELRLSIFDLRRNSGAGIAEALADTTRQLAADGSLTVNLVLDEDPARLATGSGPQILRIAQEAITNAQRHAHARTLWVTYRVSDTGVYLRVADDGQGIDITRSRADSYGMTIMRERAARINGDLTISPREGGGTVVTLTVQPATASPRADIMGAS